MATIRVQVEDFDAAVEARRLSDGRADVGAIVTFVGLCRDEGGRLVSLEIEHYPEMAAQELARVAAEAEARWPLLGLTVIHRFGVIPAGAQIVLVAAASAHRGDAFAAAEFLMDYLKTRAPFWKRARLADGTSEDWVEAKEADALSAARWASAGAKDFNQPP
jgi:molybdopterin synthase catalytic subunit